MLRTLKYQACHHGSPTNRAFYTYSENGMYVCMLAKFYNREREYVYDCYIDLTHLLNVDIWPAS